MKRADKNSQSGVVLLTVLSGILILTVVALALASSVRVGGEELGNRKEHLEAYYLARGGVYTTAALLTHLSPTPKEGFLVAGQRSLEWEKSLGRIKVEITDESGKIDVNEASEELLERLLVALGIDLQSATKLAMSILDWRSPSSLARWSKAAAAGNPVEFNLPQATGSAFRSVEELLAVPGVTPEIFYGHYARRDDGEFVRQPGLVDCVTVDSKTSQININYAPYPVLLAVSASNRELADAIVAARESQPIHSVSELTSEFPVSGGAALGNLTTQSSSHFTLLATGWARGGIVARIEAVVNVSPSPGNGPFEILRWKDSYVQ